MSFIWDDSGWFLVDDEDSYDKSRFVVARKLCVKPSRDRYDPVTKKEFSSDGLRRHFGEIESIELLPNNEPEAHLTFVSSRSAYFMLLQHEFDKEMHNYPLFEIEPVDSWEQPPENVNPPPEDAMEVDDEQTSEMFVLNKDCLLHFLQFLDLDSLVNMAYVCKMFNQLLRQHCFPRIQKYKVDNNNPTDTLAKVRRTMLCIGSYITDLSYEAHYGEKWHHDLCEDSGYSQYGDVGHTSKFLRVIAQNVGQNIRRAYFEIGFDEKRIETIAPILRNLESLEIADHSEESSYDIDFLALCPDLIEFKVAMKIPMKACCKPWPSLRRLSVTDNWQLGTTTFISFVQQNPQLTRLEFEIFQDNVLLFVAITRHLLRLEKLSIIIPIGFVFHSDENFAADFENFGNLPLLSNIKLNGFNLSSLKSVLDHLTTFINLRKINLCCNGLFYGLERDYRQSLVNLVKQLSLLEELLLEDIPMKEETLVDIVRFGGQLKVLHVDSYKLVFSDELILRLVNVLKCYRQASNVALQLFLKKNDWDKLDTATIKEIERHLHLKCI